MTTLSTEAKNLCFIEVVYIFNEVFFYLPISKHRQNDGQNLCGQRKNGSNNDDTAAKTFTHRSTGTIINVHNIIDTVVLLKILIVPNRCLVNVL